MNKKIVVEIDNVRHILMPDRKGVDYCVKDKCSLFGFCQRAPVTTCMAFATSGHHFEKETHSPQANEDVAM